MTICKVKLFLTPHRLALGMCQPSNRKYMMLLECGPMPNVMAALPSTDGALCSTPQSLADAQYWSAMQ